MPRVQHAKAQQHRPVAKADGSKAGANVSGWLNASTAEHTLRKLCGHWRDHMGSMYSLSLDKDGIMEVRTTRPRGKTMRTRGLVRIEWKADYGRVVWGRVGARALFTLAKLDDDSLTWQSNRSKPFHWDRQEQWDEDEPEAEESGDEDDPEDQWAWNAPYSGAGWDDEGWEEGWHDDDWEEDEDWEEEDWEYDVAADAAKRRVQLRRELQETRRQVTAEQTPAQAKNNKRWNKWQNKWEKPAYKKVSPSGEEEEKKEAEAEAEPEHAVGAEKAASDTKASTEALKSMLGINRRRDQEQTAPAPATQDKRRNQGVLAMFEEAHASGEPEPVPWTPSPAAGPAGAAKQDSGGRAPEKPKPEKAKEPEPMPPARGSASVPASSSTGAETNTTSKGTLPLSSPTATAVVPGQELKAGCDVERVLNELCTGVASKSASASSDAVHVNRLEHVVQGFLGQPWFTPAWSNNSNAGWAFDLQWVTSTLEWYFSDMNLCGDLYLRSLMMPDEGWVPLMLLMGFPRLQALGVDHVVLGQAAMVSTSLEVDSTGHYTRIRDKVRRAQWLPMRSG